MIAPLLLAVAAQTAAIPKDVVVLKAPEEVRLVAGGRAEARLVVTIKDGFRIQANPASERFLVPARLELGKDERVRVGPPVYPPGKPHRLRGASSDLSVYEGSFVIRVPLEAPSPPADANSALGVVLEGALHYQACNDEVCLRPSSVPARLPVRIEPYRTPPAR